MMAVDVIGEKGLTKLIYPGPIYTQIGLFNEENSLFCPIGQGKTRKERNDCFLNHAVSQGRELIFWADPKLREHFTA